MFHGHLEINPTDTLLKARGIEPGGRVQKFVDQESIRYMDPLTPRLNGLLTKSVTLGTVIGSGELEYTSPYARYHYYGKLMVSPTTGSPFASKGEKKVLTDRDMEYNGAPQRGPFWFERMKADHKEDILDGARKVAGAK
ncbi:MAG: minor capsid protein [Anaerocolumna sp.]